MFERRMVGTTPEQLRGAGRRGWSSSEVEEVVMESTAQYWRPVWEALERHWQPTRRAARRRRAHVRHAASGAGPVESGPARPEARFSRCGTVGEAVGRAGADAELCAGRDAAPVADGDAPQVSTHAATGCSCRTAWSACSRKRTSRCRVWSPICWGSVRDGCCGGREWRNRSERPSRRWAVHACTRRRISCATRSAPARICIPSTGGSSR